MSSKYIGTKLTCYVSYIVQAVIINFLPILFIALQDVYYFSYEQLARLIAINFLTQMFTDLITPKIVNIMGYRKAAFLSQAASALGLLMLALLPKMVSNTYFAILISVMVYAFGSGLIEVVISPIIEMLPTKQKSGNMSLLHSFYCWGQAFTIIITTALVAVFGYKGWSYIPLIWAILPFINMFPYLNVPIVEPKKEEAKEISFSVLFKDNRFKCYMVMMFCAGASEIAMAQWASMFAQKALGVSKVIGDLAGPCLFAVLMGVGRVSYAIFAEKISFKKILIWLNVICCACYLLVAVCNQPVISLVFCAICGFTVSVAWPGIYSLGARDLKESSTLMFSVFAVCGDLGCCFGPWLLGVVADKLNLNAGFGVCAIFPIIMIITTLFSMKTLAKSK